MDPYRIKQTAYFTGTKTETCSHDALLVCDAGFKQIKERFHCACDAWLIFRTHALFAKSYTLTSLCICTRDEQRGTGLVKSFLG